MGCFIEYIQSQAADGDTPSERAFDADDFEDYIADRMLEIDEEMFTQYEKLKAMVARRRKPKTSNQKVGFSQQSQQQPASQHPRTSTFQGHPVNLKPAAFPPPQGRLPAQGQQIPPAYTPAKKNFVAIIRRNTR